MASEKPESDSQGTQLPCARAARRDSRAVAHLDLQAIALERDKRDDVIEIKPGESVPDIEVHFSDRKTELSGTFVDAAGRYAASTASTAPSASRSHGEGSSGGAAIRATGIR